MCEKSIFVSYMLLRFLYTLSYIIQASKIKISAYSLYLGVYWISLMFQEWTCMYIITIEIYTCNYSHLHSTLVFLFLRNPIQVDLEAQNLKEEIMKAVNNTRCVIKNRGSSWYSIYFLLHPWWAFCFFGVPHWNFWERKKNHY